MTINHITVDFRSLIRPPPLLHHHLALVLAFDATNFTCRLDCGPLPSVEGCGLTSAPSEARDVGPAPPLSKGMWAA